MAVPTVKTQAELQAIMDKMIADKYASYTNVRTNSAGQTIATTPTGGTAVISSQPSISGNLNDPNSFKATQVVNEGGVLKPVAVTPDQNLLNTVSSNLINAGYNPPAAISDPTAYNKPTIDTPVSPSEDVTGTLNTGSTNISGASPVVSGVTPASSTSDILNEISNLQTSNAIQNLKDRLALTESQYAQDVATAEQEAQARETQIGVQDTMARKDLENRLAVQGLSGAGSLAQGNIAQNVITAGNTQANLKNLNDYKTALSNQLAEARLQAEQGIATAETEAMITQLENQLENVNQAFQAEIATISRYANDYMAEINRRKATADTEDDKLIPYLEAARQEKISSQGLDQQGNYIGTTSAAELSGSVALDLWERLGVANESIANALGVNVGDRYSTYAGRNTSTGTTSTTYTPTTADYASLGYLKNIGATLSNQEALNYLTDPATQSQIISQYGQWAYDSYIKELSGDAGQVATTTTPDYMSATKAEDYILSNALDKEGNVIKDVALNNLNYLISTQSISGDTATALKQRYGLTTTSLGR